MIEPPEPGFTGVIWEARPTDRLARELTSGPGSAPLGDAAAAWTRLAASFGTAVLDYDRIIATIRDHWRSDTSDAVLERISAMRNWLMDAAAEAGRNAEHAGRQAAAYEMARLAMPHMAEIAALEQALRTVRAIGASLGGPMIGAVADIDADRDVAKTTASRVMRIYEAATEPLAQPWPQTAPPPLATAEALEIEQAEARSSTPGPSGVIGASVPTMPFVPTVPIMPRFTMPTVLTESRVRTVAQPIVRPEVVAARTAPAQAGISPGQALPSTAAQAAAANEEEQHTPRAGAVANAGVVLDLDAGLSAVPSVLGGPEPKPTTTATSV